MFEKLSARALRRAQDKADAQATRIAARLADTVPARIEVETFEDGVRISGRGLRRRSVVDATLRGLLQGGWR